MNSTTVESTALAAVAYEESQKALQLEFRSGARYEYIGVPAGVHEELLDAASKGSYFNRAIRGRYSYRLLVNPEAGTSSGSLRAEGAR
jgi:KTSC domain